MTQCPDCKGSGQYQGFWVIETCRTCGGTGVQASLLQPTEIPPALSLFEPVEFQPGQVAEFPLDFLMPPTKTPTAVLACVAPLGWRVTESEDYVHVPVVSFEGDKGEELVELAEKLAASAITTFGMPVGVHDDLTSLRFAARKKLKPNLSSIGQIIERDISVTTKTPNTWAFTRQSTMVRPYYSELPYIGVDGAAYWEFGLGIRNRNNVVFGWFGH